MLTCVICFSILSLCSVRVCMLCAENAGPICVSHWIQHADSNKWNNNIESTQSAKPTRNGNKKKTTSRVNMRDCSSFFACVSFSPQLFQCRFLSLSLLCFSFFATDQCCRCDRVHIFYLFLQLMPVRCLLCNAWHFLCLNMMRL